MNMYVFRRLGHESGLDLELQPLREALKEVEMG